MKDLLKWALIGGGAWWAWGNLFAPQAAAEPPADTSGPQPSAPVPGTQPQPQPQPTSPVPAIGPIRAKLQHVAGPLSFWHWNHHAGVMLDPFSLPRWQGKGIPDVENDRLTMEQYLSITGLQGLGCACAEGSGPRAITGGASCL